MKNAQYYYIPSLNTFYVEGLHTIPSKAIAITEEQHRDLIYKINNENQEIYIDNGVIKTRDKTVVITWDDIRSKRNYLLSQSDYTQMSDWPGDKAVWAEYRQELRDITENFETPDDVVWPTPPK